MKKNFLNTLVDVKRHRRERPSSRYAPEDDSLELEALPTTFDARDEWSQCITISDVMDQGPCYSAYVSLSELIFQEGGDERTLRLNFSLPFDKRPDQSQRLGLVWGTSQKGT